MTKRFAIVTPYYKEERAILERCIASVKAQTLAADHILVADGFPQDWIDAAGLKHVRLDRAHGDYGNVARGVGGVLAAAEDYDGIGFLDADNTLEPDHVRLCVEAGAGGADLVAAKRRYVRLDGSEMPIGMEPDHIDTSCFWYQPGAYSLLPYWITIPNQLAGIGDRLSHWLVQRRALSIAQVAPVTVNYTCTWRALYLHLGEEPPPNAQPLHDMFPVWVWLLSLPAHKQRVIARLSGGIDMAPEARRAITETRYDTSRVKLPPPKPERYAIVTPYRGESRAALERCIASVKAQTLAADHFLIAGGPKQDWLEGAGLRHITLPLSDDDGGNVARGLGAALAVAEAYDGIGFLDADGWLAPEHVALCVAAGRGAFKPDIVAARTSGGGDDPRGWWFNDGAQHLMPYWAMLPREIAALAESIVANLAAAAKVTRAALEVPTINGASDVTDGDLARRRVLEWIVSLSEDKRRIVARRCAGDLVPWARGVLAEMDW